MRNLELKRLYVQKAYDILNEEGIQSVTIRRLGKEVGCNAASLYRCFEDIDELFLYVGLKFLKEYLKEVNEFLNAPFDRTELYLKTWDCFLKHSFARPQIFNGLFFSKYDMKINYIIADYYRLFPEELEGFDDELKNVFLSFPFSERNLKMLKLCVEQGAICEGDLLFLSDMIIQLYKGYLKDFLDGRRKGDHPSDVKTAQEDLMCYYRRILQLFAKNAGRNPRRNKSVC